MDVSKTSLRRILNVMDVSKTSLRYFLNVMNVSKTSIRCFLNVMDVYMTSLGYFFERYGCLKDVFKMFCVYRVMVKNSQTMISSEKRRITKQKEKITKYNWIVMLISFPENPVLQFRHRLTFWKSMFLRPPVCVEDIIWKNTK